MLSSTTFRATAFFAALMCVLVSPARAEEPTVDEVEYRPNELPPEGAGSRLVLTGLAVAVGWYGASAGVSLVWSDAPRAQQLRIPVVGPWMNLGDAGCAPSESNCGDVAVVFRTAIGILSSVGQVGGIVGMLEGLLLDTAPHGAAASADTARVEDRSWVAVPTAVGSQGWGLSVVGRF